MDIESSEEPLLKAAACAAEAFFVASPTLCIVDADRTFVEVLGITREQVERGDARLPSTDRDALSRLARSAAALGPGEVLRRDVELAGPHGAVLRARVALFPRHGEGGRLVLLFGSLQYASPPPESVDRPAGDVELATRLQAEIVKRQRSEQRLRRLLDFNSLLASVNHAISVHEDESQLLQAICDLAAQQAHLALTYIARPNAEGRFEFLAASGRIEAIDNVVITTDARSPRGRGTVGQAWHDGKAHFNDSYAKEPSLAPWKDHALAFGLRSNAAVALHRQGAVWAVLSVYHDDENIFDVDLRNLLVQIGLDVSRGLDRLDLLLEEKRHRALRESLLTSALVGIVMTRGRRIVEANTHFAAMLGYRDARDLVGRQTSALYPDEAAFERVKELYPPLYATGSAQLRSASLVRQDGELIACDLSANMVYEAGHQLVVWTVVDVTARDALQRQIAFESLHDVLTGLPNRRSLDRDLGRILARAERMGHVVAVGMLDLDDFKQVNDTLGHEAGDELLRSFAQRLQSFVRASDLVVRLGGDEFVVVIGDLEAGRLRAQLANALDRLHQAVESPFTVGDGRSAEVGMTMGIAVFPSDAGEPDALIRQADAAMYQCKQHKHDRARWWRTSSGDAVAMQGEQNGDLPAHEGLRRLGNEP